MVQNDIYVYGCLSCEGNVETALQRADKLQLALNHRGFTLKGVTFTGSEPTSVLSTDNSSVNLAGIKLNCPIKFCQKAAWKRNCTTPKQHTIQIDRTKLCFKSG